MIVRGERLPLADRRVDAIVTGPSVVELCAGAGGMALGFEQAGFRHAALYEIDSDAVTTLRLNRPAWDVRQHDVSEVDVACPPCDVLAAGVPCPPFSQAGRKLGPDDERDLFPALLSWVRAVSPKAVVVENVSGLLSQRFDAYRRHILATLEAMGYEGEWRLLDASLLGVPQRRRRSVLVAMRSGGWSAFRWPVVSDQPLALGPVLAPRLAARGLPDPEAWAVRADSPAPTICGGSKKHGGADLGPSSARRTWGALGV